MANKLTNSQNNNIYYIQTEANQKCLKLKSAMMKGGHIDYHHHHHHHHHHQSSSIN